MADTEAPKTKKRKIKHPKLFITVGLVVILAVAGTWWYRYNQAPAEGTIHNQDTSNIQTAPPAGSLTYSGKAVKFTYPGIYTNLQKGTPSGVITEQVSFAGRIGSQESRKIALTVKQLGGGLVMKEDAAYKSRLDDKSNYAHTTALIAGKTAEVFTRKDGTEITYIIPGEGKYVIISGTTTNPTGLLAADTDMVIKSVQWQN